MDSPDTHTPPLVAPEDSVSLFDVMAATQRVLAGNIVDVLAAAAQQEADLHNAQAAADKVTIEKDAAVLAAQASALEAEQARTHDSLTGLPNKAYLKADMERRIKKGEVFGVFEGDITGFKSEINDKLGHEVGDRFLVSWSNYASTRFTRSSDLITQATEPDTDSNSVSRTGGDEFHFTSSLQPGANRDSAYKQLSVEQRAHREYEYIHTVFGEFMDGSEWAGLPVDIAVGYAIYDPTTPLSSEALLQRADEQMYDEKQAQHSAMGIVR